MTVRLTAGEEQIEVSFPVEVVGAALPPQTLVHTEWFHADCLATWYGVEPLSEEHWTILGKYMKNAAAYGINLLLTPVFFAAIGINVKLDGVSGGMLAFSVLLLVISVISKLAGCGLGAKLCGFTERESIQVGVGMVCRGEVALIVANRGLSMGVLSSAMMTPVVITVVGGTILTPILLKLVFRGEPQEKLVESSLADRYEKTAQLEDASQQLLDADAAMMRKNK